MLHSGNRIVDFGKRNGNNHHTDFTDIRNNSFRLWSQCFPLDHQQWLMYGFNASTVTITRNQTPTASTQDQTKPSARPQLQHLRVIHHSGTGLWTLVSGTGTITTPTSPTSGITALGYGANVFRWTISNGSCTASASTVTITRDQTPTASNAGPNQTQCETATATLAGNTATVGTGLWTLVSGTGTITTPTSPTSGITALGYGANVFRWTISNGSCTASASTVTITRNQTPTVANAGLDQTGVTTCGLTTVTLGGNAPAVGTGRWTVVSGAGGSFALDTNPTTTFTGTAGTAYTLRWTISNAPCTASTDDVDIKFNQNPTTSNAGADQTGVATCGLTTVTLGGNAPAVGTGRWTVVSGAGGSFALDTNPTTTFTGTAGTTYTLRWTISNAPCTASTDDVDIKFNQNPTTSNAGADQTGVATCGLTTVTLGGNAPAVGTGRWTVVSGAGGSFALDTNPTDFTVQQ